MFTGKRMIKQFIFDVDGTLITSRGVIDPEFNEWMIQFASMFPMYVVTGSDRAKTLEQIGEKLYNICKKVYQCSGNDVWQQRYNIKTSKWILPEDAHEWLTVQLSNSVYDTRTGKHFDHRPGMCNFSVVGRGADSNQRKNYYEWDKKRNERFKIASMFNLLFPDLCAKVGGETGIDIFPKGADKSQILADFDIDSIRFFGDRCDEIGNDYPISSRLKPSQVFHVSGWQSTKTYMEGFS